MLHLFQKATGSRYRFDRDPNGSPAESWGWDGAASWDIGADDPGVAQGAADPSIPRQTGRRGQQIVRELQARALADRVYALNPDELATTLGATTTLPDNVIARLARADSADRVAWGAERTRADDLGSGSAASVPGDIVHGEYLTAAPQDRLTADAAAAHAAADRNAIRLAAESFPCTAANAVTAAATGAIQAAPSAARANTTVQIRRPAVRHETAKAKEGGA